MPALLWAIARVIAESLGYGTVAINLYRPEWDDFQTAAVHGGQVQLTYVEFEVLHTLALHPGRVYTRQALLEAVWGDSAYREPRTIDVHIRHLREKLEQDPRDPHYIFTVRGVGYRFRDEEG